MDVPGASSPYTNDLYSATAQFYRLRMSVGPLAIAPLDQGNVLVDWPGPFTLQSSTNALGPYWDVPGATHPFTNALRGESQQFYRVRF